MSAAYSAKVEVLGVRPYESIGKDKQGQHIWRALPMPEEELRDEPKLSPNERKAVEILTTACNIVVKNGKRVFPITRNEMLKWGVTKQEIKGLEKKNMVKSAVVRAVSVSTTPSGQRMASATGARNVLCFTPQGRAYVRKSRSGCSPSCGDSTRSWRLGGRKPSVTPTSSGSTTTARLWSLCPSTARYIELRWTRHFGHLP
jgi:hypothetical protein